MVIGMFYQRIQKATHLSGKISQKYMPTSPGLEDQLPQIIFPMPVHLICESPVDHSQATDRWRQDENSSGSAIIRMISRDATVYGVKPG